MKRDGVEIEIEGGAARQAEPRQRIKPRRHDARITLGRDATAVLGQEGSFRRHVQPGEQGEPLIQDLGHDMAVAPRAEEFQPQQRADRVIRRNHLRAREVRGAQHRRQRDLG